MIKRWLLALALIATSSVAWAQNPTCPTRPNGDSSNACASTAFVQDAFNTSSVAKAIKAPVRAATTANITLSGAQTIDGVSIVADDRVLVKNQSTGSQNGIYVAAAGAWSRSTDADATGELVQGTEVLVNLGTVNTLVVYKITTADPISIGSTSIAWSGTTNATQYGVAGASGVYTSGPTTPVAGVTQAADWTWGTTAAVASWQTLSGLWAGQVYNGMTISKSFAIEQSGTPTHAWPNNALFLTGTNTGSNNGVNALMAVGHCTVANGYCSGANFIAVGDNVANTKLVGMEIDVVGFAGQTVDPATAGVYINAFNIVGMGPAIQTGSAGGGSWTNGVVIDGLGAAGAGLTANTSTSMGSLVNSGSSVTYGQDFIVAGNQYKIRLSGTASVHAKLYNDSNDVLRIVNGDNGTAIRNSSDASTYLFVADTGQVGVGSSDPATALGGLQGFIVLGSGNVAVRSAIANSSTGAAASAQTYLATGTANSLVSGTLQDNSGVPYFQWASGTAITSVLYDFALHTWRSQAGSQWATLNGSALTVGLAGTTRGALGLSGNTSGVLTLNGPSTASGTITLPAGTTDFTGTGGTGQVVKQASVGAPFTVGTVACSDISGGCRSVFGGVSGPAVFGAGTTVYTATIGNAAEGAVWVPINKALTVGRLYINTNVVAPGVGQTYVFTVRKNAANTAVTCTISGGSATSCNDTSNTVTFAAGDVFTIQGVGSAGAAAATWGYTIEMSGL